MTKGFRKQKRAEKLHKQDFTSELEPLIQLERAFETTRKQLFGLFLKYPETFHIVRKVVNGGDWGDDKYMAIWADMFMKTVRQQTYTRENIVSSVAGLKYIHWVRDELNQYLLDCEQSAPAPQMVETLTNEVKILALKLKLWTASSSAKYLATLETQNLEWLTGFAKDVIKNILAAVEVTEPFVPVVVNTPDDIEGYRTAYIMALRNLPYAEYLKTEHWKRVRELSLDRAKHRCQTCNTSIGLHVHHRTYANRGDEKPEDLTVLCDSCHKLFHDNRKLEAA